MAALPSLRAVGEDVMRQFRDMERAVDEVAASHILVLQAEADAK